MIFDDLCAIVERHLPQMTALMQQARLFSFPGRAHEILPKSITDDEIKLLTEHFFLPFPKVAIEDTASCVLLWDSEKEQQGIGTMRYFVDCIPMNISPDEFGDEVKDRADAAKILSGYPAGTCCVTLGTVTDVVTQNDKILISGKVAWSLLVNKTEVIATISDIEKGDPMKAALERSALRNAQTALSEVFYFNNPTRFVVEKLAVNRKVPQGKAKNGSQRLARSAHRPQYTLLAPAEIREKFGFPTSKGTKKQPHERRRHFRTFKSDHYKEAKGKTIVIPASWVGPSETVIDEQRYRVMLEL